MKKILLSICILSSFLVSAQVKQKPISYGVQYRRIQADSAIRIPLVQVGVRDLYAGFDTAQLMYNKVDSSIYLHTGSQWIKSSGTSGWGLVGNASTVDGTSFIGTTDNIPFNIRVNNQSSGKISSAGPTFFGYEAGELNTSTSFSASIGFGWQALAKNTSGTGNTAFGLQALYSSTISNANVAVGNQSMRENITSSNNTAVGTSTLINMTGGSGNNTAVGVSAMGSTTTGHFNTAVGYMALTGNLTGGINVAIGMNALKANLSDKNTAVGAGAMENSTTGNHNTAVGYDALLGNTTGNHNVGVGWNSLAGNQTGSYNIGIGHRAGNSINGAGATYNVFIGYEAGNNASQLATATNSVAIGAGTYTTASNQIILGSSSITQTRLRGAIYFNDAVGSSGQVLTSAGAGSAPTWETPGGGVTDHGALTGLADDDHTQYLLLAGRGSGQTAYGGIAANEDLTFEPTSHATKTSSFVNIANAGGIVTFGPDKAVSVSRAGTTYPTLGFNDYFDGAAYVGGIDGYGFLEQFDATGGVMTWYTGTSNSAGSSKTHTQIASLAANGEFIVGASDIGSYKFQVTAGASYFSNGNVFAAGSASANTAPIKLTSGAEMSSNEAGTVQYDGNFSVTKENAVKYTVGGNLTTNYTDVGNVGTGVDNLMTYSVPAGTLSQDGDYIEFTMTFTFAENSNSKQVKVVYGATEIYASGAQAQSGGDMTVIGKVIRTGATTQKITVIVTTDAALFIDASNYATATETLSGAVILKGTGEAVSNNDIIQVITTVKFFAAN